MAKLPNPTITHPLWAQRPDKTTNGQQGATTWRCKVCHGWDYKGATGAYAKGSHRTGLGGILAARTQPKAALFQTIKVKYG